MDKNLQCRDGGDSFHVDIAIDEDGEETENLSHRGSIDDGEIEERGDSELSWVIESVENRIAFRTLDDNDSLQTILISFETAMQLADALTKAAKRAGAVKVINAAPVELDKILTAIRSTTETTFNEFCSALKKDCPAKEDKASWRELFKQIEQAEAAGYVYVTREEGKITAMILSEKGANLIREKLDDSRPLLAFLG